MRTKAYKQELLLAGISMVVQQVGAGAGTVRVGQTG